MHCHASIAGSVMGGTRFGDRLPREAEVASNLCLLPCPRNVRLAAETDRIDASPER